MDQLKVILKQLQKHHFWLLCLTAMITSLVGWTMARKSLSAAYDQQKSAINAKFSSLEGLKNLPDHPNSSWKQGISDLTEQEKKTVGSTWEKIYNEQKQLLKWPPELGDKFLEFIDISPAEAEIIPKFRESYQRRIPEEFPKLLKIVDADSSEASKPPAAAKPPAGKPPAVAAPDAHEPKVLWDSKSQQQVKQSLEFLEMPTSLQLRQTQENLWVYQAILRIIKSVNDADKFTSSIKLISVINIGKEAAEAFADGMAEGHVEHLAAAAGGAAGAAAQPAGDAGAAAAKGPDDGRYVDADGKRLPSAAAATSQFKRMPIFLRLVVDQRRIPELLVACANSPLPVEVRQLRINPGREGARGGGNTPGASGGPPPTSRATGTKSGEGSDAYEVPIELHGIIYIYNKPDMNKANAGQAGAPAP
jgi:hypothetical protein